MSQSLQVDMYCDVSFTANRHVLCVMSHSLQVDMFCDVSQVAEGMSRRHAQWSVMPV